MFLVVNEPGSYVCSGFDERPQQAVATMLPCKSIRQKLPLAYLLLKAKRSAVRFPTSETDQECTSLARNNHLCKNNAAPLRVPLTLNGAFLFAVSGIAASQQNVECAEAAAHSSV
jgi:hypothetical protein